MSEELKYRTTIQTERLLLKPISLADADDIYHIRSFREIYQWTIAGQWTLKSQATEWITANLSNPKAYNFSIYLSPPSTEALPSKPLFIGSLGSARDDEIGYMFHPDYWGRGYATEALRGFLKVYFEKIPDAVLLKALTDCGNTASRKVLEKVGFVDVGRTVFDNPTLGPQDTAVYEYRPNKEGGEKDESATSANT